MSAMPSSLADALADVSAEIDARFDTLLAVPGDPRADLYRAMRHAAIGGGKRLRPLLVFATANLFGVDKDSAARVATALEAIHVYSLILAGDCLHALAFEILADPATHPDPFVRADLVLDLAKAAGPAGMAGGQMMDLEADSNRFDLNTVTRLQQMKTGALISASVEAGAILGKLPPEGRVGLRGYAHDLGLAFQIADDLLDAEGDEAVAGKKLRKDDGAGKETFLSLLGADRAREQAHMLVDQAIAHLHAYGQEADLLRDIARFVLERDR